MTVNKVKCLKLSAIKIEIYRKIRVKWEFVEKCISRQQINEIKKNLAEFQS